MRLDISVGPWVKVRLPAIGNLNIVPYSGRLRQPEARTDAGPGPKAEPRVAWDYLMILVTVPEPTVRPPSRIAKP